MSIATEQKTTRFLAELETASWLRDLAMSRGTKLNIGQAHEAWAEHSDDYCAQWLVVDSENPKAEGWKAISKWRARRETKK